MKPFILIFLLVLTYQTTQAQYNLCMCNKDSAVTFKQYELSLTSNIYFKYNINPYFFNGIMLKKYFNKWIVRVGYNYNEGKYQDEIDLNTWASSDTGRFKFNDIRIGFEKPIFNNKFYPYLAADLMFSKGYFKGKYSDWGGFRGTFLSHIYQHQTSLLGLIPAIGIKYRPINKLSFGFEIGSSISYYQRTKKDLTNQISETNNGILASAFTTGLFSISYYFIK
jgi:hypothetical protein